MSRSGGWKRYGLKPVRNRRDDALARIDPPGFERLMADYFRRQGYTVEHVGTGGRVSRYDGGIDLKLYRDGEYTVVQCKRENAYQVTHNVMHELLGVMLTERATKAIVINTGEFTNAAWQKAAHEPRVQLVDGNRLREMLASEPGLAPKPEPIPPKMWGGELPANDLVLPPRRIVARRRKPATFKFEVELIKLVFCIVALIALWQCSRRVSELIRPSRSGVERTQEARQVAPSPQTLATPTPTPMPAIPARSVVVETQTPPAVRPQPTPEELRREQRRTEEAMKVIEATTPEM